MKKVLRAVLATAAVLLAAPFASAAPAGATEVCADGTVLGHEVPTSCPAGCPLGFGPFGHPAIATAWTCVSP